MHSNIKNVQHGNMRVQILPALQDNFMYLIIHETRKQALIVDPVEPKTVNKTSTLHTSSIFIVLKEELCIQGSLFFPEAP